MQTCHYRLIEAGRRMRRATALLVVPAMLLAPAVFAASAAGEKRAGDVKRHGVGLYWYPDDQDIVPGSKTVLDTFDSEGAPFDDVNWAPAAAETLTPRNQSGQDTRTGKWRISFGKQGKRGTCFGTFKTKRDVIYTTESEQRTEYAGVVRIDGCRKSRRFANLRPGKLGDLEGFVVCDTVSCSGQLYMDGGIYY
jgi:hypothetical protein